MKREIRRILIPGLALIALTSMATPAAAEEPNPFFSRSTLQYQTPPFDKI